MSAQSTNPVPQAQQPAQPALQQQQPTQPASNPPARGQRGRGRGRGRGGNTQNRDRAIKDLNTDGLPVGLGKAFLSPMTSLQRKNVEVKINQGFTEIAAESYKKTIQAVQETRGMYDDDGNALDLRELSVALAGGLCNATVIKLLHATPESELPDVTTFFPFRQYQTYVPKSFVKIVDLIGKTDFNDWVIRVKANASLVQRLLLKSISYFKTIDAFVENHVSLDADEQQRFDRLDGVHKRDFDKIFFADRGSVSAIKEHAENWLKTHLNRNFRVPVVINGEETQVWFGYPQLPEEHTKANIVDWLSKFQDGMHPDFENIIATGLLLLVNSRWMSNPNTRMDQLDAIFQGTAAAAFTPITILNASGLHHFEEYLSKKNFIEISRSTFSFYGEYSSLRLQTIFQMMAIGIQTTGSPGQLLYIPADHRDLKEDGWFDRYEPSRSLNHSLSYMKVDTPGPIIISSAMMLTDEVFFNPDYQAHFAQALSSIRSQMLSVDAKSLALQDLH